MVFLPPGERIDGTVAECAHLHLLLACFRASPPPMRLPEVAGRPLPDLLSAGTADQGVFRAGYDIMAARYEQGPGGRGAARPFVRLGEEAPNGAHAPALSVLPGLKRGVRTRLTNMVLAELLSLCIPLEGIFDTCLGFIGYLARV